MKKWTYLVAAGMLLGAAPVFTGCIDNDEPEGITILRGAKAELLKAKAAVEAAKVAQVQAEAALLQAQAKYQEALAVTEAANAKIQEAIAKQEEAKAALLETQNEQAKQELQAAIAELEHQKEMWEIEKNNALTAAEQAAKMWELSYKQAEVEYEKALVELESKKTSLTSQQLLVLNQYISDVKTAKTKLAKAQQSLKEAERKMQKAADLVKEAEADKEYWQYELARTLKLEQYALEGAEAAKTTAEEELKEMQATQPTELGKKLESIKAEVDALYLEILNATMAGEIEREAINEKYLALYQREQQWYDNRDVTHVVPEFTFPEGLNDAALPLVWIDNGYKDLEFPEETYSLNNPSNMTGRINILNYYLATIKAWTRDANDDAWTSQRIAEWKKENEVLEANIETEKAEWKEAVDAYYRTPADAVINLTKIEGYSEFLAAIPAFNTAVREYQEAFITRDQMQEEFRLIQDAYSSEEGKLYLDYDNAKRNIPSYEDKEAELTDIYNQLGEEYQELLNDPDATPEEIQAAYDKWIEADPWNYYYSVYRPAEEERCYNELKAGIKELREEWNTAADKVIAAIEAIQTKKDALNAQVDKIVPLYELYYDKATATYYSKDYEYYFAALLNSEDFRYLGGAYDNPTKYTTDCDKWNEATIDEPYSGSLYTESVVDQSKNWTNEYELENVTDITIDEIRYLIAVRSKILFGTAMDDNAYGDPNSQLLEMTYDDVKAAIEASSEEPLYGTAYINACSEFGLMGDVFANEARIEFAEAWIADKNNSVNKLIEALSSAVEALETEYNGLVEASEDEREAIQDAYLPLEIEYNNTYDEANYLSQKYNYRLEFYYEQQYIFNEYVKAGIEEWTTETIEAQIKFLEEHIRGLELEIEDQKHEVEAAQRNLDGYNDGNLSALETATEEWEDAMTKVTNANDEYTAALELLKAILNKMSLEVSDDTTTTEPAE